ncbi:hypothetical protein Sjap_008719 [Stephania japonica]|uniref:Uncharacterized protein n=1 Tax=Stephania japonica TaxID=461633 RepID=A0AAP0JQX3_9MAGN|nr:COMT protein [Stephania japonica]
MEEKKACEEEDLFFAFNLIGASAITMALRTAAELNLFEIMSKAGPTAQLSASEIASHIPTKNPEASNILDRVLSFLASHSVLTCSVLTLDDNHVERRYGLAPVCKYFVKDENGGSLTPLLNLDKVVKDVRYHLKDAILEEVVPFQKVHGMPLFEYLGKQPKIHEPFPAHGLNLTDMTMTKVLDNYKGFDNLKVVVDLGGGIGTVLKMLISQYPNIRGINIDLPHVIARAPPISGVEHVVGDVFGSIPKADAILMKNVLHIWNDEQCIAILKNCYDALPDNGKVIVIDMVLPAFPEPTIASKSFYGMDITMILHGGKERTKTEFKTLARKAGFAGIKVMCHACTNSVVEFCKNL